MTLDRQQTLSTIREAFSQVDRPAPKAAVYDLRQMDCSEMMSAFGRFDWWDIPQEALMAHRDAIHMLSPEGYRYYLPAFMSAVLQPEDDDYEWEWDIMESVMASMVSSDISADLVAGAEDMIEKRLKLLTPQERAAIVAFIGAFIAEEGAYDFAALTDERWAGPAE
jgi:hypothetical protein